MSNPNVETASQRALRLMSEVGDGKQESYSRGEVKTLLNNIAMSGDAVDGLVEADFLRRGDVFIFKLVGGKTSPWVVLSCRSGLVSAVGISSGDSAPGMVTSQCRLWPSTWIGTTVSLFREDAARKYVTRPYTNVAHLREIEGRLHDLMRLRPLKAIPAEVAA